MDTSFQSSRRQRAWTIVRRLRQSSTQRRDKPAAPAFITDGVGEAMVARVTEQVREIVHRHREVFPGMRLREVLLASGDARSDSELAAWSTAFTSELRAALTQAARASFRLGVEDGPGVDTQNRAHPTSPVGRDSPLDTAFHKLEEPVAREVQEIVAQLWTMINAATADDWDVESILEAVRAYLFALADERAARMAWSVVYRHWHAGQHWIHEQTGSRFKIWHVDDLADNCDICLGNVDAGEIRIAETFPSGHLHPMVHWRCQCWLEFTGMPRRR
jgi:hypothetical protein